MSAISKRARRDMKKLLLLSLLVVCSGTHAESCIEMEHRYEPMPSRADGLIAKRVEFKVPPQMLDRFQSRACAVVSFHIDGSGSAYDVKVVSYHPSRGIGRAAMHALKGYEFVPGDYRKRLFVLMLKYNRFELK